jgi:hypothetical protein
LNSEYISVSEKIVTIRLSLNFILGVKIYTLDREARVSGKTSVTIFIAVRRAEIVGKVIQEQRERVRER